MSQNLYEAGHVVLNTDNQVDQTATIPDLSGHQGDNQREIKLAIKDGTGKPVNMTNRYLALVGTDPFGVVKIAGDQNNVENAKRGWVDFRVPAAFYQAMGTFYYAYFEIRNVETDEVISSINCRFDVSESGLQMTTGQSDIFNNLTDNTMEYYYRKIKSLMGPASSEADRLNNNIQSEIELAKKNGLAVLGKDNTFTGTNTFNAIHANSISDPWMGHVDHFKCSGVNGAQTPKNDLIVTIVWANEHFGHAVLTGWITLPAMKGYTKLEVIHTPVEAMRGGQIAYSRLSSQNNQQTLFWFFDTGDSGRIWVQRQDGGTSKPDTEWIEVEWDIVR